MRWVQYRLPFIAADPYPDFDDQMDTYLRRAGVEPTVTENWGSEALMERGPRRRQPS